MTLTLWFIYLLFLHFVADFLCQNDRMALGKSKDIKILFEHVSLYSAVVSFGLVVPWFLYLSNHLFQTTGFFFVTVITHFITDFFTSRANAYLYDKNRHWFFVMIGFDQFIHGATLLLTFQYFFGNII